MSTTKEQIAKALEFEARHGPAIYTRHSSGTALFAVGLLAIGLVFILALSWFGAQSEEALAQMWADFKADPWRMLLKARILELVAMVMAIPVAARAQRKSRVVVTPDGIRVISGLPWIGARFGLDWDAPFAHIDSAAVSCKRGIPDPWLAVRLQLAVDGKTKEIQPAIWFLPDEAPRERLSTGILALRRRRLSKEMIDALPLIAALRQRGVDVVIPVDAGAEHVREDLASYPVVMTLVVLSSVLGVYFFIDAMFLREYYLIRPSLADLAWLGMLAALVAVLAMHRLSKDRVPTLISACVALFFGMTVAMAAHPGLLRIGQLVGEFRPMTFTADGSGGLAPADASKGVPSWRPDQTQEFWASRRAGERIDLNVRRGVMGLWQYDLERVAAELDRFYGARPESDAPRR